MSSSPVKDPSPFSPSSQNGYTRKKFQHELWRKAHTHIRNDTQITDTLIFSLCLAIITLVFVHVCFFLNWFSWHSIKKIQSIKQFEQKCFSSIVLLTQYFWALSLLVSLFCLSPLIWLFFLHLTLQLISYVWIF